MIHYASKGEMLCATGLPKSAVRPVCPVILFMLKSSSLFCSRDIKCCLNCDSIEDALLKHRNYLSFILTSIICQYMFILVSMIKTVDLVRQIIRHNSSVLTKSAYFITYNESHLPK